MAVDIIEKNVNASYFDERYLDELIEKLLGIENPVKAREESKRLHSFFARDCASFIPKIAEPNFIERLAKLGNAYKLEGLEFDRFWELVGQ